MQQSNDALLASRPIAFPPRPFLVSPYLGVATCVSHSVTMSHKVLILKYGTCYGYKIRIKKSVCGSKDDKLLESGNKPQKKWFTQKTLKIAKIQYSLYRSVV